jgi:hypothetical protein
VTRLRERWESFWFAPDSPATLGFCRLLFFAGMLWLQFPFRHHTWGGAPKAYRRPVGIFEIFDLPFLNTSVLYAMEMCWVVAMVLAAVGLLTRFATLASFACGLYLLGIGNNFGKVGHGDQALALVMLILALSRCGDAWSLDALIRRWRKGDASARLVPSGEYRWPIRMVWLLMAMIFWSAGASKLQRSGLAWITSDHLANTLVEAHYYQHKPPTRIGLYLASHPLLCNVMAAGVVLLELSFPLALLFRRLRAAIVVSTLLMQVGIGLLMAVWFRQFLFLYIFWVPWDRLGARFRHGFGCAWMTHCPQ